MKTITIEWYSCLNIDVHEQLFEFMTFYFFLISFRKKWKFDFFFITMEQNFLFLRTIPF